MNPKKIFLTDLDGTLLNDEKSVTPATMEALQRFCRAGNVFSISTGRGTENAVYMQQLYSLTFPGSFVIAYNGAEIWDHDRQKVIYRVGIELPVVSELLTLAAEMHVHVHTFNDRYIVGSAYGEEMVYYKRIIRTPVIPTFNDTPREIDGIAAFASSLPGVHQMHILPYHRLGYDKYVGLGRPYTMGDLPTPSIDKMRELKAVVERHGLTCIIGG